jgi:GTP cyclohydrolase IA
MVRQAGERKSGMAADCSASQNQFRGDAMNRDFLPLPKKVDKQRLAEIGRELLIAIGEDPEREGLKDTPRRFAGFWAEFMEYEAGKVDTAFESIQADQMVVVSGMRVWSVCEHHLLPFWCDVSVAYIADNKVLGLSKFARIAKGFARRPQVQERLVSEISQVVKCLTGTEDVAVVASGVHLCMVMRGIETAGLMTSSSMHGKFRELPAARQELMSIIGTFKNE